MKQRDGEEKLSSALLASPRPLTVSRAVTVSSNSLRHRQLVTCSRAFSITSILICRSPPPPPLMSLVRDRDIPHSAYKANAARYQTLLTRRRIPAAFSCLLLSLHSEVRARHEHLLPDTPHTSIYPFICSPVPFFLRRDEKWERVLQRWRRRRVSSLRLSLMLH